MEDFIEMVKQNKVLYDTSNEKYKDIKYKDDIWMRIALDLDSNLKEVKQQWKNLQNSYREAKKRKKGKTGEPAKKMKELPYMALMTFIDDYREDNQLTSTNIDNLYSETTSSTGGDRTMSDEEDTPSVVDARKKRSKSNSLDDEIVSLIKQNVQDRRDMMLTSQQPQDALKVFFDSMYTSTKKLQLYRQLKIKKELFNLVTAEEEDEEVQNNLEKFDY